VKTLCLDCEQLAGQCKAFEEERAALEAGWAALLALCRDLKSRPASVPSPWYLKSFLRALIRQSRDYERLHAMGRDLAEGFLMRECSSGK
jgi:hypothetical protein